MIKKIMGFLSLLILCSCGSYYNVHDFYNSHKNDDQVTAVQVPRFMFAVLKGLSPEMNSLLTNVNDVRYIKLQPKTEAQRAVIQNEIDELTTDRFTDIVRKNDGSKRSLISVREQFNEVKEIIVYNNDGIENSLLYLNGSFHPETIKTYAKEGKFDNLTQSLTQQYQWNTTAPKSY